LSGDFETDMRASKRLDAATWKDQRSIFAKTQEKFWAMFGEIF